MKIISTLDKIKAKENLDEIKNLTRKIYAELDNQSEKLIYYNINGTEKSISKELLLKDLKQILDTNARC